MTKKLLTLTLLLSAMLAPAASTNRISELPEVLRATNVHSIPIVINPGASGGTARITISNLLYSIFGTNQFTYNGTHLLLKDGTKLTNSVGFFSINSGPATNPEPVWTSVEIGSHDNPTWRWTSDYGDNIDFVTFRGDPSATVSNIVYHGNQNDGRIFAWDWKIGGVEWGNLQPRYVWNFLGNDEGSASATEGVYIKQTGIDHVQMEAYTRSTSGGMFIWDVTGTTLSLGAIAYPTTIRGSTITAQSNFVGQAGQAWMRRDATLTAGSYTNVIHDRYVYIPAGATRTNRLFDATTFTNALITVVDAVGHGAGTNVVIIGQKDQTINGAATFLLDAAYEAATLQVVGTNWIVVGKN